MQIPAPHSAKTLQAAYEEQYTDAMSEWREIGGRQKAENILKLCEQLNFSKVLECGAGEGSILKFLDKAGTFPKLHALEISDSGIAQIKKRNIPGLVEVRKFDGYQIPYPDKFFDMAYCSHVLEHVEHPRILLRELKRVSNYQVFEVPLDYSEGVDRDVDRLLQYGHINVFTPSIFKFLLRSEGYEIMRELHSHSSQELIRFNWYRNMNVRRSLKSEALIRSLPIRRYIKRLRLGRRQYREFGYSAYSCLAQGTGELKIF